MKIFISHGMHGGPESAKVPPLRAACADLGRPLVVPDYREIRSPEDRVRFLLDSLDELS